MSNREDPEGSIKGIGACNTMIRKGSSWYGVNTDVEGFLAPLKSRGWAGSESANPKRQATVLGAGGAARAVVYALIREGIDPLILNRSLERARALARSFGCAYSGLNRQGQALMENYSDLIVQATSVGMEPEVEGDPLPGYHFRGTEIVYDLVYKPPLTRFLKRAGDSGCTVIQGLEMLRAQAGAQFKLFTGRDYPV
ncbi:Shikimate dehydrogenase (NADP(+)) [subsurface metagenome]